jgi:hypothetical protein
LLAEYGTCNHICAFAALRRLYLLPQARDYAKAEAAYRAGLSLLFPPPDGKVLLCNVM